MPLELDDREPPEYDPDAPAPALSVARVNSAARNGLAGVPAVAAFPLAGAPAAAPDAVPVNAGASGPRTQAPRRTCYLMRQARPVLP